MNDADDDAVWLHSRHRISIVELEQSSGLPQAVLRELVELGALSPSEPQAAEWQFAADCVARVRAAAQLSRDLELETSALALALTFIGRIEELEARVRELSAQQPRSRR
jgi:chaperone modulatory protein CbpM